MKNYEPNLSRGLDFYKLTMGDMAYNKHPDAEVTFTFNNRNVSKGQLFSEYVTPEMLRERLEAIRERGFQDEEIAYFAGLKAQDGDSRFTTEYLDHLTTLQLPEVTVATDPETHELAIASTGPWANVSPWETVIMSELNEMYYEQMMQEKGLSVDEVYNEADRRLSDKIALLKDRPDVTFADFGTRRRFSARWHEHVIGRLAEELPENFVGTSNPWFAHKFGIKPIGTFAHEMPMVYSGIADSEGKNPLEGNANIAPDWEQFYRGDLSIYLPDTFTTDYFFETFTPEQAAKWTGLRHDSGPAIDFGERAIEFYEQNNIDPKTKTLLFSDGLTVPKMITLTDHFKDRVITSSGIGTDLTCDMHPALPKTNDVVKATRVNGVDTVKLSDESGKHTGPAEKVQEYKYTIARIIGMRAAKKLIEGI